MILGCLVGSEGIWAARHGFSDRPEGYMLNTRAGTFQINMDKNLITR